MSSKILSAAVIGLDAEIVEVEADMGGGGDMGTIAIVGLPDMAVSESRERVRSAIKNSSLSFPRMKITVNLAPADLKKHGPSYDLPIAISVLSAAGKMRPVDEPEKKMFVGELALSGKLRPVNGILAIAAKAAKCGIAELFVPRKNAREAKLVEGVEVYPVENLGDLVLHLEKSFAIAPEPAREFDLTNDKIDFDMAHIRGQQQVKRAMEIAAAGAHNMMMSGPPGSGKTLIARTMPSILPDLTLEESLEITKIYSVAGYLPPETSLIASRPFRAPHHTASNAALIGGGTFPRPGEISLSHRGVLFLDEFAEFPRQVLESLRQPLEDGIIHVSRAAGNLIFPAKFVLVSAMNPCPCGFWGDSEKKCACSPSQVANYRRKISGPIIDRIDIHVDVPRVKFDKLVSAEAEESSKTIRERVRAARNIQQARFNGLPLLTNSEMNSEAVKKFCPIDGTSKKIMRDAVDKMHLSARSYFRILKLARTIADLAGASDISQLHLCEALQYRPKADD